MKYRIAQLWFLAAVAAAAHAANFTSISTNTIHLGAATPEWSIFEGRKVDGAELRLKFNSTRNEREHTLFIRQDDVKQDWIVTLNGQKLGSLFLMEADLIHTLPVGANLLLDGENELHIFTKTAEDILIRSIALADDVKPNILSSGPLKLQVEDGAGSGLPARITIVDANGSLAALRSADTNLAIRPGVVYTKDGGANLFLLPGKYTVYATRGPEYSLARAEVTLKGGEVSARLVITNEVITAGWVSSDTHIHTFSLSKHGDALLAERMITLAAEAIELPIATEHNLHADYAPAAKNLGLEKYFTIVPGNEVTTRRGHFNVFPVVLAARPADQTIEDWPGLLQNIHELSGVRVVILNHPTDTHVGFTPFAATNFNRITGKNLRGDFDFSFDAVEVINSGAMRSDWMEPFRCWFALLNRGSKITGVGASDSHDVSRFIVGQGRTYIRADDSDPAQIDVQKACDNLKAGRAIVSLGLFPQLKISDAPDALDAPQLTAGVLVPSGSGPGDLHQGGSRFFEVAASVDFPTWINPTGRTTATLYENGRAKLIFPFDVAKKAGRPLAFKARFPKPKADSWYVLIAQTPGVTNTYWSIARPYQPSSPEWEPAMLGATNPIYLDADGDGHYSPPRATAARLRKENPESVIEALAPYDWAVAAQAAELLHAAGQDLESAAFQKTLSSAPIQIQQGFADYLGTIVKQ